MMPLLFWVGLGVVSFLMFDPQVPSTSLFFALWILITPILALAFYPRLRAVMTKVLFVLGCLIFAMGFIVPLWIIWFPLIVLCMAPTAYKVLFRSRTA